MTIKQFFSNGVQSSGTNKNNEIENDFFIEESDTDIQQIFAKYYFNQSTAHIQLQAKHVGNVGDIISEQELGITPLPNNEFANLQIDLIISDISNDQGTISVHVRAEKNNKIKNKIIAISGYKIA